MKTVLEFLISMLILIGVIVGTIIFKIYRDKKTASGTLKVNTEDPDGPYLFLELSQEDLNNISSKKQVILKIDIISRK